MHTLWQDVRYGLRMLAKNPAFAAIVVLTIALGIGANIAAFSTVNAVILRPYGFPQLDQLILVQSSDPQKNPSETRMTAADFADLQHRKELFQAVAAYRFGSFNLTSDTGADPEGVEGFQVSPNLFDLVGAVPARGRGFLPEEGEPGHEQVVLLSDPLWRGRFGGDPSVVGSTVQLDGRRFTVVGIMPKDFLFPLGAELWVPLALTPQEKEERSKASLDAVGRLLPNASLAQARTEMLRFGAQLEKEYPKTNRGRAVRLVRLREEQYDLTLPAFLLLQVAAALVLLLACANAANLYLARMIGRAKEIAVRGALGAGRRRFAQLFVIETLLLAPLAGILATALSYWCVDLVRASIPPDIAKWLAGWNLVRVDGRVLGFAVLVVIAVGFLFGIGASQHALRMDLNQTLREEGSRSGPGRKGRLFQRALVAGEMALALVVLVGAGQLAKGLQGLASVLERFEPRTALTFQVTLSPRRYPDDVQTGEFFQRTLGALANLPGVEASSVSANIPGTGESNSRVAFAVDGRPVLSVDQEPTADMVAVSEDYFKALRIPIVSGRAFSGQDGRDTQRVAIVSRTLAQRVWPGEAAVGRRIKLGPPDSSAPWISVVGVASDVKQDWWNPQSTTALYLPYLQAPARSMHFVLRSSNHPVALAPAVRSLLGQMDRQVPVRGLRTLEEEMQGTASPLRMLSALMGAFGGLALFLAATGVYAILAHTFAARTHEVGVRMALGASPGAIRGMVIGDSLRLATIGLALGAPCALLLSYAMASLLFGVVSLNPAITAGFAILLAVVAIAAGYFPARRATQIDPVVALRGE